MIRKLAIVAVILGALVDVGYATSPDRQRYAVVRIVTQIQRADYEGERVALKHLYAELARFLPSKELASRVHYWRGFALWRRALNGFNDSAGPMELREDLEQAVKEFDEAVAQDPQFVDAKIGAGS